MPRDSLLTGMMSKTSDIIGSEKTSDNTDVF